MTTQVFAVSYASSSADFECCACTIHDQQGVLVAAPRHCMVYVCRHCGHMTCAKHTEDGLCWGCWSEERG